MQCHFNDRVLEHAPTLTRGRDLYQLKGCIGCHRHEEFDREADALTGTTQGDSEPGEASRRNTGWRRTAKPRRAMRRRATTRRKGTTRGLRTFVSTPATSKQESGNSIRQAKFLMQDQKKIGPNLKDVRLKLRKEWIPVWLKDPQAFRPGTKMPTFRLSDDEIRAISAFIWQSGAGRTQTAASQAPGDPARGKELYETAGAWVATLSARAAIAWATSSQRTCPDWARKPITITLSDGCTTPGNALSLTARANSVISVRKITLARDYPTFSISIIRRVRMMDSVAGPEHDHDAESTALMG